VISYLVLIPVLEHVNQPVHMCFSGTRLDINFVIDQKITNFGINMKQPFRPSVRLSVQIYCKRNSSYTDEPMPLSTVAVYTLRMYMQED